MAAVKYSISFLKRDPLLKIKVTGIYHEKDKYFYYQNPVTGYWQRIKRAVKKERSPERNAPSLEGMKKVIYCLKSLTDKFYEENKDLFGGTTQWMRSFSQGSRPRWLPPAHIK